MTMADEDYDSYDDDDDVDDNEGNRIDDEDFDDTDGNVIVGARAKAVVEYVTRQVAEEPDAIDVEVSERGGEVTLLVHADQSDMGRLIGKRGRVIQALRRVTRAAGAADDVKATVDIVE